MVATTSAGIAAGLSVGSNLPTPSATTDGVYVVVSTSGTPASPAPAIAFAPPDYILGVTNSAGSSWNEVDLSQTVAGQVASNITFTPYGQISSTNVQDAMQELETEKLALSGGTVTGQVLIGNTGSLVFEGSTVDAYELTLAVADPQNSDKTITLPDITGTLITTGDTNTVTSTMVDASLVNANLAATAAIAFSKLAALTSAQILVGNGSNVPTAVAVTGDISINNAGLTAIAAGAIVNADISNSAQITGSKVVTGTTSAVGVLQLTDSTSSTSATTAATPNAVKTAYDLADAALPKTGGTLTGDLTLNAQKDLRFADADSSNYVALQAPATITSNFTLTLPSADAAVSGYVLASDAAGTLSWVDPGSSSSPTFTGDATLTNDGALVGFSTLNATYTGNVKTLVVTVASKTGAHRYQGSGSGSGYKIGGKESPFITLTPGRTYKFDQADSSNSGHPLRFYLEADKTTAYTTGVTTNGTAGSSGAYTQIVVSDSTPQVLHYQCSAHSLMGNAVQTNSNIASTAKTLATARTINGTSFDGSANITVTAAAGTLTGATLANGVTASSLTSVGTLTGLTVSGNILMSGTGVIDIPAGTTGQRPGSANTGMFRYNTTLNQFEGYSNTGWGAIGGGAGATGGSTDEVFMENDQTVTTDYTLGTNKNAVSVGNLTVNNGVTITIPNNATWVVL